MANSINPDHSSDDQTAPLGGLHSGLLLCSVRVSLICLNGSGADLGFLERGFVFIKVWGFRFAELISFFLNIP